MRHAATPAPENAYRATRECRSARSQSSPQRMSPGTMRKREERSAAGAEGRGEALPRTPSAQAQRCPSACPVHTLNVTPVRFSGETSSVRRQGNAPAEENR